MAPFCGRTFGPGGLSALSSRTSNHRREEAHSSALDDHRLSVCFSDFVLKQPASRRPSRAWMQSPRTQVGLSRPPPQRRQPRKLGLHVAFIAREADYVIPPPVHALSYHNGRLFGGASRRWQSRSVRSRACQSHPEKTPPDGNRLGRGRENSREARRLRLLVSLFGIHGSLAAQACLRNPPVLGRPRYAAGAFRPAGCRLSAAVIARALPWGAGGSRPLRGRRLT